eukprot:13288408-Ditylum_brightwellii.AAC.1
MVQKKIPKQLWDYALVPMSNIMQQMPRELDRRTVYEGVTGNMPDVSEYTDFNFYNLVCHYPNKHLGVDRDDRLPSCWLGVSHQVGSILCYWILTHDRHVMAMMTVSHITHDKYLDK